MLEALEHQRTCALTENDAAAIGGERLAAPRGVCRIRMGKRLHRVPCAKIAVSDQCLRAAGDDDVGVPMLDRAICFANARRGGRARRRDIQHGPTQAMNNRNVSSGAIIHAQHHAAWPYTPVAQVQLAVGFLDRRRAAESCAPIDTGEASVVDVVKGGVTQCLIRGDDRELCRAVVLRGLMRRPMDERIEVDERRDERGWTGVNTRRHRTDA